jgi:hypothetical protein
MGQNFMKDEVGTHLRGVRRIFLEVVGALEDRALSINL